MPDLVVEDRCSTTNPEATQRPVDRFAAATPRPWQKQGISGTTEITAPAPRFASHVGVFIARLEPQAGYEPCSAAEQEANAALIVTAVNSHDRQQAILREFIAIEEEWQTVRALDSAADLMERRVAAVAAARLLVAEGE